MKLIEAKFRNYRLLKDLVVPFSIDDERNLTIIRAANDTGKTTILTALQWGLFGDEGLPNKGVGYRMHPIDWNFDANGIVDISVEIDFEHTWERPKGDGSFTTETQHYIALRCTNETMTDGDMWSREPSKLTLYEVRESGHREIPNAEARLKQVMGSNLKDLFFTDGDRALTFITLKLSGHDRKRLVKTAIRDMLSFEVLDNSKKHINSTIKSIIEETKRVTESKELSRCADELAKYTTWESELSNDFEDVEKQISLARADVTGNEKKLEEALRLGNREDLETQLKQYNSELESLNSKLTDFIDDHARLFVGTSLSNMLLGKKITDTTTLLNELKKKGVIPKTSIPILKERIQMGICICGSEIKKGSKGYDEIVKMIKLHEQQSELDDLITELKFSNDILIDDLPGSKEKWQNAEKAVLKNRQECEDNIEYIRGMLKKLDEEISKLPEVDIKLIREKLIASKDNLNQLVKNHAVTENRLNTCMERKDIIETQYNSLLKKQKKAAKIYAKLDAARDILEVINYAYEEIESMEIPKITEGMNKYFLEMIQSDQQQNKIIHHAEVTEDYEINVKNPQNRILDTDSDLNGASRRALTLSFILALTKVSGVDAPNVIDTPLGMMDPIVKASTLDVLCRESKQAILLLTRSEINDIEELLDVKTGSVITLTNTAHYPEKIVDKPKYDDSRTVSCDCNHRQYCEVCERKGERAKGNREKRGKG